MTEEMCHSTDRREPIACACLPKDQIQSGGTHEETAQATFSDKGSAPYCYVDKKVNAQ